MVIQETSPSTKSPSPVTEHLASTGGLFDSLDRLQPLPTLLKAEEASVSLMMDGADQEIAPQDTDSSKPSVNSVDNISIPLFTPLHVPPNHPVLSWSTDDVAQWMQSVGIRASIAELFAENGIDGFSLPRLNHSILSEDLGITSPQLRSTLLLGIEELFSSPLPSFVPSLAPNTDPDPGPESRGNEIDEDEDLPPPYLGDRRDRS
ncbi:hypothetical protein BC829DRAFT_385845 [Chytridium lagenaria]|nr:hypothetical protein BC829DRAFT_385845 [Chytridium lagenaria]